MALSENLTGGVFVNQSAAYSDFHGTGLNPACVGWVLLGVTAVGDGVGVGVGAVVV